jgi:hypothetical protein
MAMYRRSNSARVSRSPFSNCGTALDRGDGRGLGGMVIVAMQKN